MPRATTTTNINRQQPTKNTPAQQRRKWREGAMGGECGEIEFYLGVKSLNKI
jgi:hypothetical protein